MKQPLMLLAAAFCLGIFLSHWVKMPVYLPYILAGLTIALSIIFFKRKSIFTISLCLLACLTGTILLINSLHLAPHHITKFIPYSEENYCVLKGFVTNEPDYKNYLASFIFRAQEIQIKDKNYACCGKIIVYIKIKPWFNYGDELILRGKIRDPFNEDKRKKQSYRDYLRNNDIWYTMFISGPSDIISLNKNNGFYFKRLAINLKNKIQNIVYRYNSPLAAGILNAMILGEKSGIPYSITQSMMRSGTLHILVVSGFNVGIVTLIIISALKLLRAPRKIRFFITIPMLIFYCLITGSSNPVVRATIMAIIIMVGLLINRETDIYSSLSLAAISILAINPKQLFDVGFQLSFLSVFSIVSLYPKIKNLLRLESLKTKPLRYLSEGFAVSLSAWIGTILPVAYYFKAFSPITPIANLFIVPLASLITLTGFSLVSTCLFSPFLASAFSHTNELLVALLLNLNTLLLRLPAASISWT